MKKYLTFVVLIILGIIVIFAGWNVLCVKTYKVKDVELTSENIIHIQKTFLDFKLPSNSKIEKASKIIGNGALIYAKVIIPQDKIEEFNLDYQYEEHLPISELEYEINNIIKNDIKWWNINKNKVDYIITPGGPSYASMKFIYLKPENGFVTIYMKQ